MSIMVMGLVWKYAALSGSELLILLTLADHGDDDGKNIYPSIIAIASKARLSPVQARRIVHKLIDDGFIELVQLGGFRNGRNWANEYHICLSRLTEQKTIGPRVDESTSHGREDGARVDESTVLAPVIDQSSLQPSLTTNSDTDVSEPPPAATPKRSRSKKKTNEPNLADHPLIAAYVTLHNRKPQTAQMKIIIARNPPLDDWIRAMGAWAEWGYNPTSVGGILEWALNPAKIRVHKATQPDNRNAFGLQRNGTHNATSINAPTADEEQPAYDSEFGRAIRESNRRMAEEYAAKQAAQRGVSMPHL